MTRNVRLDLVTRQSPNYFYLATKLLQHNEDFRDIYEYTNCFLI